MIRQLAVKNGNTVLEKYASKKLAALSEEEKSIVGIAKMTYFQCMAIKAFNKGDISERNMLIGTLWAWFTSSPLGIVFKLEDLPNHLMKKTSPVVA